MDGGREDIDFEGDSNNLGWGKEETTLTDGSMAHPAAGYRRECHHRRGRRGN